MKNRPFISQDQFKSTSIGIIALTCLLIFSNLQVNAQILKSRKERNKNNGFVDKNESEIKWKKNVIWLDGLGSSQIVSFKYERILNFGPFISARFEVGVTPFLMDEKYNFIVGRSITPTTGLGIYINIPPSPIHFGFGCTVLHDIFFDRIPETMIIDSAGTTYPANTYRARIMPYVFVEGTIKNRYAIRGGYSPIIDPANDGQKDLYFTHWVMIGFGYKFGK